MNDTIAAISTALGIGAISIIRLSGEQSIEITNKIFKGKDLTKVNSHTINYGHIIDNNEIIDEVLVSVMKAPKTYTLEDIVEINCHGGIATTNKVLELVLNNGARLAEPGEFSKRAFLNGRIDLIEAEGIMNLIESQTQKSREIAINQLSGKVSELINNLRDKLIQIISNIEVNIDYPEYDDVENLTNNKIKSEVQIFKQELIKIKQEAENGKLINEGIKVAIIGKPNVGKSSLLNSLLEEEKAIVTNIEGTTRDIVEGNITISGIPLHIIDTAGIRKTTNLVEQIGVTKSINIIDEADLIIYMLNNNEELTLEDMNIYEKIKDKKHIIVINKIDLHNNLKLPKNITNTINLSIINNQGINELKQKIIELFNLEQLQTKDLTYLSNARSISLLTKSEEYINNALNNININIPIDMVEIELKNAWEALGEIIGKTYKDELIDEMFSRFCLGK